MRETDQTLEQSMENAVNDKAGDSAGQKLETVRAGARRASERVRDEAPWVDLDLI